MKFTKHLVLWIAIILILVVIVSIFYKLPVEASNAKDLSGKRYLPAKYEKEAPAEEVVEISERERQLYFEQKSKIEKAVHNYFQNAIRKGLIVGAGVSVVKGDSTVLAAGYGKRKIKSAAAVDGETVFRLGSLSKGFTGILAGKFKNEGLFDWDDSVHEYVPQLEFGRDYCAEDITISHMLSHTTGAPYHSFTDRVEDGMSLEKIAAKFSSVKPISTPGKIYSYQNAMFAMTGEVTERITCYPFATDLKRNIFEPLRMTSASTDYKSLLNTGNKAYPHRKSRRGWTSLKFNDRYYNAVPAGGINASSADMAQWMHLLLGHREDIMSKEAIAEVFEPQIKMKGSRKYYQRWKDHTESYYAYGWRVHKFFDEKDGFSTIIHHGGTVNNFRNEIAIFPEEDMGICVLMSSLTPLAKHVIPDLQELILNILKEYPKADERLASN